VIIAKLRRVGFASWCVAVVILLALIPWGPISPLARYLLAGYLPGLAIWKILRSDSSSLIDLVLYPSLLSILPFAWIGLACVAFGLDLRLTGTIAVAVFLIAGFWRGWGWPITKDKRDQAALCLTAILAILLLVAPFAANSFQAVAWDGPLHAAIVSRILGGAIPPDSPIMAGEPLNYYWLYHFYSAVLMRLTGLSIYQIFALINVHAFILFALAGYRLASRLTTSLVGRLSAMWMLLFGLNAFGWIIFLSHGSQNPDKWYSLVAPFAMVRGYSLSLASVIHEFLDGFPFPVSFAYDVAWLDCLILLIQGARGGVVLRAALILATIFYLHPLSAAFLVGGSFAAVLIFLLLPPSAGINRRALIVNLSAITLMAAAVTAPYAWNILHAKAGMPLSLEWSSAFVSGQALSMVAAVGFVAVIAAPAFWSAFRQKESSVVVLILFGATVAVAALVTHVALEAEYKLIYLLAFGLAPLIALSWHWWGKTWVTRLAFIFALAFCVPTNAFTSYCFLKNPPRENRDPTRLRLLNWIREQTPVDAICVEYPWWEKYQTSDAAFLYLDRYWFDLNVYANRRQLIGYGAPMLEQWGYRDIELRQALAGKLTKGERLAPADVSYLAKLHAPIIVIINASVSGGEGFDPAAYQRIYEDGNLRAYRVVSPNPEVGEQGLK
jgi:hypothetical protein